MMRVIMVSTFKLGITTYTMFAAYEAFPHFMTLSTSILESNNDLPDLIDEVLWNLRWMLPCRILRTGVYQTHIEKFLRDDHA